MVDMGTLVGTFRRVGLYGPPYEVLEPATPGTLGEPRMRVHLLESDEVVEYAVADILNDPLED